jgi:hypothetical protein
LKCGSLRGIIHGTRKHFRKGATMRLNTIQRRKARRGFEQAFGKEELVNRMYQIIKTGKEGLDGFVQGLGVMLVEAIMDMERGRAVGASISTCASGGLQMGLPEGISLLGGSQGFCKTSSAAGARGRNSLGKLRDFEETGCLFG